MKHPSELAIQLAVSNWQKENTSNIEMDSRLATEFALTIDYMLELWKPSKIELFMLENGLGEEDMKNDITYPKEI